MRSIQTLLATVLLVAAAVGCDRLPSADRQSVRFIAEGPGTRTVFTEPDGSSYPVIWTEADEAVKISLNNAEPVEAAVEAAEDGRTARFSASFSDDGAGTLTFRALSPASAFLGIRDGQWTFSIPTEQTATATSVDPAAMVLAATKTCTEWPREVLLGFEHLSAYGTLSLSGGPGADLRAVTLAFSDADTVTVHTSTPEAVWFGIKPFDASGKELTVTALTTRGTYTKTVPIPEGRRFEAGRIARFAIDLSDACFEPENPSISILAIGNSFSIDAMEYLYGYLKQAGYTVIFLGNLYIGGCTLETHAGNLTHGSSAYDYYTNSTGTWNKMGGKDALSALKSRKWDYISLQQASGWSGMPDSYDPYLSTIVDAVRTNCPESRLMWHQTWAYQANSNHSDFPKYGCVQIRMYNAIVDAVRTKVLPRGDFDFVIPSGTAIQNLRTSLIGDTVTRDGYHLSYNIGRVAAALTWLKQISGCPLGPIDCKPSGYSLSGTQTAAIKDAVEKACAHPLEVTPSAYPPERTWHEPDPALQQVLADAGYDPALYRELPYSLTSYAFYNSSGGSGLTSKAGGSTASNIDEFAATQFFSLEDIPVGSVLVLKTGYQYRPEGWTRLSVKTSPRPGQVKTQVVTVDENWWKGWAYRAFNLSKDGNPHLSQAEMESLKSCLSIFVPKEK